MADLDDLSVTLDGLLSDLEPVRLAIGLEGKDAAHDAIERSVGSDRSLSGMARKAKLSAGFDMGRPVVLNLRPKGLILLADEGRKRTTEIVPKGLRRRGKGRGGKGGRRRTGTAMAVTTPHGPRASSTSRPSDGNPIIEPLLRDLETRLPKAAQRAVDDLIERQL